jgi:hypothetical protein
MAQPDIVKGTYVDLLYGDGATTELFTPFCGLTARSFTQQGNTNDVFVPDCADPESVPTRRLVPTGKQWDLSGEGLLNLAQRAAIDALFMKTKNYRFRIARPAGSIVGAGYYQGPAMLTNIQWGGSTGNGEFATGSLTIASDGDWVWTAQTT